MSSASSAIDLCNVSPMVPPATLRACRSVRAARTDRPSRVPIPISRAKPDLVRRGRRGISAQPVGRDGMVVAAVHGPHPARDSGQSAPPAKTHEARDPVAADVTPLGAEHGMDPRRPIAACAFGMASPAPRETSALPGAAPACRAPAPRVVSAGRDPRGSADHAHRPEVAMLIDKPEFHRVAAPKTSAAVSKDLALRLNLGQLPFQPGAFGRRIGRRNVADRWGRTPGGTPRGSVRLTDPAAPPGLTTAEPGRTAASPAAPRQRRNPPAYSAARAASGGPTRAMKAASAAT